jgi:hypothetical protein
MISSYILKNVRGYGKQIVEDRKSTVRGLFDPHDATRRAQSLDRILALNRPVAIVLDEQRHVALLEWLEREGKGISLYQENGFILWLVEPEASEQRAKSRERRVVALRSKLFVLSSSF